MKNGNVVQMGPVRVCDWSRLPYFLFQSDLVQLFGGISRQTLYNWEKEKGLPAEHISRNVTRYRKDLIMKWIENGYKPLPEPEYPECDLPGLRVV